MGNKKTKQPKTDPAAKPDAQVADKPTAENKKNNLKNVTLKIFIIGDFGVGKTSLALRFAKETFNDELSKTTNQISHADLDPMVGGEKIFQFNDTFEATVIHFDTAGNEKSATITPFAQANIIFICFAINNSESFNQLAYWHREAINNTREKKPLVVLVGTKQDLNSDRRISQEEAEKWCKAQTPTLLYVEVSAKTGHNVKELYSSACKELVRKVEEGTIPNPFESEDDD